MKYPVRRRLAAQDSLERIVVQIAEHDLEAAYRFVDAVERSLSLLSEMPEAGPRYETENAALAGGIRKWVVPSLPALSAFLHLREGRHTPDRCRGREDRL